MKQHTYAIETVQFLKEWMTTNHQPIVGYQFLAEKVEAEGVQARNFGQVCSLIDYACFVAGLPHISYHWVRDGNGKRNEAAWDREWTQFRGVIAEYSAKHIWTDDDFDKVLGILRGLPSVGARTLWKHVSLREKQNKGFIAYNLHRAVR